MKTRQTAIIASIFLSACGLIQALQAQEVSKQTRLERLFSKAVIADGTNYIALRKEILADKNAESFLSGKASDTNLVPRVLARAMLTWVTDATANTKENETLLKSAGGILRCIAPTIKLLSVVSDNKAPPDGTNTAKIVVLLEIALKGITCGGDERCLTGSVGLTARSLAIGRVGSYIDHDVVPSLCRILEMKRSYPDRACAVIGLRHTKKLPPSNH